MSPHIQAGLKEGKIDDIPAVSVFSDWSLSLIPIWIIRNLQLGKRNKVVLCTLMGLGIMLVKTSLHLPGTMNVLINYSLAARVSSPSSEQHISYRTSTKKTRRVSFVHCRTTVVKTSTYRLHSHKRNSPHLGRVSLPLPQSSFPALTAPTSLERNVACIVACVPASRPLVKEFVRLVSQASSGYRNRRTGYSTHSDQHELSRVRQRSGFASSGGVVKDSMDQVGQTAYHAKSRGPETRSEESILPVHQNSHSIRKTTTVRVGEV